MRIPAKLLRGKLTPRKLAAILLIWLAGVAISHFAGTADFGTRPTELAPIPESAEGEHSNAGTLGFAAGFVIMMILDVALG